MLNDKEIKKLIEEKKLIENYIDLDKQITQNGFDITVSEIFEFKSSGSIDFSNSERTLPKCENIEPTRKNGEKYGWWLLEKGVYKIRTNEVSNYPNNIAGFALSRTTLLRMGASTQNGFWEAGFSGRAEAILTVRNINGINIKENARIMQMVFFYITKVEKGYDGIYKNM